jgi:hypothetical protein
MSYKKPRLGTKLMRAALSEERYRDIHVFIGGTGAVGGTALLQMLSMYEEMISIKMPKADHVPILVTTGKGPDDLRAFTTRLFRFIESRHGAEKRPRHIEKTSGYLTHSGIFVALERFQLATLSGLDEIQRTPLNERAAFVRLFISKLGETGSAFDALRGAISKTRPMSTFLRTYQSKHFKEDTPYPFRSVVIGIPIPSLVAYHLDHLTEAASYIEGVTEDKIEELKIAFRRAFRDDLEEIQSSLAETVLVAHTTAVGGMYDEDYVGEQQVRTIRLGFAHSAQDTRLIVKQREAEEFTREYSQIGIKMLITAAAIGIDAVKVRAEIPLHFQIAQKLSNAPVGLFTKKAPPKKTLPHGAKVAEAASTPSNAKQVVWTYQPVTIPLDAPSEGPISFREEEILKPAYSIRSGENGLFSVSNADALYRVMRVASASELGQVLATVGLFGDDTSSPWFPGNVCYYTETDNSRQVFDLLYQPRLFRAQLSGLEPLALQDLGSAKHQGELHTLSLLILLHRLRTLDIDAVDPYIDLDYFDPALFFIEHSRPLTFEDLAHWDVQTIAQEMQILVSADKAEDLAPLNPSRYSGLFHLKDKAVKQVLERVLKAVWMIPSLGSPLIFERDGRAFVRTGYFVAPLDLLVTDATSIDKYLREEYEKHKRERFEKNESLCTFEEYRDFHICTGGFVDLRPTAILCTAKTSDMALTGRIKHFSDEQNLRAELFKLEPYSFFTTCGLVALLFRLRGLYNQLREAMAELGTLHEFRWQMPRDHNAHILVIPGAIEAFRMVSEGLEKTTGTERLDGIWGYERRPVPERWDDIPGLDGA